MPWLLWIQNNKGEPLYLVDAVEDALSKMIFIKWSE